MKMIVYEVRFETELTDTTLKKAQKRLEDAIPKGKNTPLTRAEYVSLKCATELYLNSLKLVVQVPSTGTRNRSPITIALRKFCQEHRGKAFEFIVDLFDSS